MSLTSNIYSTDADHIYYDINIVNHNEKYTPIPLNFTEVRTQPFLDIPSNYYCSIVRFELSTPNLPVFIPHIQQGQNDINRTVYKFNIDDFTTNMSQHVSYIPSNTVPEFIHSPFVNQDLSTTYYYVYSYSLWCDMLNNTLRGLMFLVNPTIKPPFFKYDSSTSLFSLYIPCDANGVALINLSMNTPLQLLFSTFPYDFNGYDALNNKNYTLKPVNFDKSNIQTISGVTYLEVIQEVTTIASMNPISSVVFTSLTLPIVSSLQGSPQLPNTNNSLFNSGNSNLSNTITDFIISMGNGNYYKPSIEYTPEAEYRLISMYGSSPLTNLDITVGWKDRYNNIRPFMLDHSMYCTIKILFRRKSFNMMN
jgi:hypothetical protein